LGTRQRITNFGGNVSFAPRRQYVPTTEAGLLAILNHHRTGRIRVVGSRHSWSDAIKSDDVLIDMRHFKGVTVERDADGTHRATIGGGCRIKRLLHVLQTQTNCTMPSVGLISEQTIAGAISTGTHGSGKHSLSHYVDGVRLAAYDRENGHARIYEITEGADLLAARCSLGCMGVIISVRLRCVPEYYIGENVTACRNIQDALALEARSPLQQFFLIPHLYRYYVQERSLARTPRPSVTADWYRAYWFLCVDLGFHLGVTFGAAFLRSRVFIEFWHRRILPLFLAPLWTVTDRSDRILVMEHELFRHLEIEIFVSHDRVVAAAEFVMEVLQVYAGQREHLSDGCRERLAQAGLEEDLLKAKGSFVHHYPICFRRILRDDTLISMSSGEDEWWYSISFITYVQPREPFFAMAKFLATSMMILFRARLHWGKYFPLDEEYIRASYPELGRFREICKRFDPNGVFRNDFTENVLGKSPVKPSAAPSGVLPNATVG